MARQDDYENAAKIAIEYLKDQPLTQLLEKTGFDKFNDETIIAPFLDKTFHVSYPNFMFMDIAAEKAPPIQEQVLMLHYISGVMKINADISVPNLSDNWISYREIKDATFYLDAFIKRAINPFKKTFGENIDGFKTAAEKIKGAPIKYGDAAYAFYPFPKTGIHAILWEGDEEFPAEANMLFNENIGDILSAEDIAWLSGMLVYRMMALSR